MRYHGRKAKSFVDWDGIDYIVGTRDDVTHTGITRPCHRCQEAVYTSREYPNRVPMICDVCALAMAEEEQAAGRSMSAQLGTGAQPLASLLDPWHRADQEPPPPRDTLLPSKRRSRPRTGGG